VVTTTPHDHEPPAPRRRFASWRGRPEAWSAVVAVVVLVAALVTLLVIQVRDHQAQADRDAQETSAWEDRLVLDEVILQTAARAGIDGETQPARDTPYTCERNDGRRGFSYVLSIIDAGPVADIEALVREVAAYWEDLGYAVDLSRSGAATAVTPDGGVLFLVAGARATQLSGDTGCALVDGAPGSEGAGG